MTDAFDSVRAALDAGDAPVSFFFRNDDGGWDDDALYRFLAVPADRGVVIDIATIPAAMTAAQADRLKDFMRGAGAARIHQHGFAHCNHEPNGRKCEFGPSRPMQRQWADIRLGWKRLADFFDGAVDRVFTPPWNRCNADTAAALARENFSIVSCDDTAAALGEPGLIETPISVDWQKTNETKGYENGPVERIAALIRANAPSIGVMTHHAVMSPERLKAFAGLLDILRGCARVRFDTLGAMAERAACAPAEGKQP